MNRNPGWSGSWQLAGVCFGRRERTRRGDRHRLRPMPMVLEDRRLMATFTVSSTADTLIDGQPTYGTLRYAVDEADSTPGANTLP
jgi:hypothetical protein